MKFFGLLFLCGAISAFGVEHATYDSAGAITGVIHNGALLPLRGGLVAEFTGGVSESLQPHDQRSPITRDESNLSWKGTVTFPNTATADFTARWTEDSSATIQLQASAVHAGPFPLDLTALDYELDLPHDLFVDGTIDDGAAHFPRVLGSDPKFFRSKTDRLSVQTADGSWKLNFKFDQIRNISVVDHWGAEGHTYRLHVHLVEGAWPGDSTVTFALGITPEAHPHAVDATVTVDTHQPLYHFDGFGGDYCFNVQTPVVEFTLDQLHPAWARLEFKAANWDRERDHPGPQLTRDFELMRRVQQSGIPWILSVWRLPERYYSDPNQKPFYTFGRQIALDRWPEFLDLLTSYLTYLKSHYGAEPNYFSFNEPDLGVNIGFTGATHRDMIKRIGARLESAGFKTKMLLGDTANPRDTHLYVLPTAADPEAMKYVGAVSFHSWGNGTPQQYRSWGEVGRWINLPLVVGEAGTDPGSYRNRNFDSYTYGLGEAKQYQELLRESRPTAIIYWQYTEDYSLVHRKPDGSIEPTGRFWLMKHFAELTPRQSQVVVSSSDQPDVAVSAFAKDGQACVHILNVGSERDVTINGLPSGPWKILTTTEESGFQSQSATSAPVKIHVPARSMVSLVSQ